MEYLTLKNSDPQVRDLEWVAAMGGAMYRNRN